MNRNLCLLMVAMQALILIGIAVLIQVGKSGSMNPESVEGIFRHLGLIFVALSPVGIISAFLSLGLKFALSFNFFTADHMRILQKRWVLMFLLWKEYHPLIISLDEGRNDVRA